MTNAVVTVFPSKVLMLLQYGSGAINTLEGAVMWKKVSIFKGLIYGISFGGQTLAYSSVH